jgi:hypothetical protein
VPEAAQMLLPLREFAYNLIHSKKRNIYDAAGPISLDYEFLSPWAHIPGPNGLYPWVPPETTFAKCIKEILVRIAGWTAVESEMRTLLTSDKNTSIKFFDYELMGYEIKRIPKVFWNPENECYVEEGENYADFFVDENERKAREEIVSINQTIPLDRRWLPLLATYYRVDVVEAFKRDDEIEYTLKESEGKSLCDPVAIAAIQERSKFFRNKGSVPPATARKTA